MIRHNEVQQFSSLELIARQVVEGFITGLHKSPFHGFSVEFAEHRQYNTGESTRHIDWKLYGRTDKYFIKRYEEETNLRCRIIIDNSSSMYFPFTVNTTSRKYRVGEELNKMQFSVYAAAAITTLLKMQRDAVGLSIFSDKVELHTPAKSSALHHKLMVKEFEKLLHPYVPEQLKSTSAVASIHEIAEAINKRSLVVIFSDMLDSLQNADELFSALQHLKHNKHEVILFHVVDKNQEMDFSFDNRPYRFVDMETGQEIKLHPNQVKDNYIAQMAQFKHQLLLKCGQYKIDFVEADINLGFEQVLMPYLVKRTRMVQ